MLKACGSYVVVTPIYEKERKSGLVLADGTEKREGHFYGVVQSVGELYPYDLKIGQKVMFRRHEGTEIEALNGKKYLGLKKEWILAILED